MAGGIAGRVRGPGQTTKPSIAQTFMSNRSVSTPGYNPSEPTSHGYGSGYSGISVGPSAPIVNSVAPSSSPAPSNTGRSSSPTPAQNPQSSGIPMFIDSSSNLMNIANRFNGSSASNQILQPFSLGMGGNGTNRSIAENPIPTGFSSIGLSAPASLSAPAAQAGQSYDPNNVLASINQILQQNLQRGINPAELEWLKQNLGYTAGALNEEQRNKALDFAGRYTGIADNPFRPAAPAKPPMSKPEVVPEANQPVIGPNTEAFLRSISNSNELMAPGGLTPIEAFNPDSQLNLRRMFTPR